MGIPVKSFWLLGFPVVLLVLAGCQAFPKNSPDTPDTASTSNFKNLSNQHLCRLALEWLRPKWANSQLYRHEVVESMRRGLNEQQCAQLSGWFSEQQIVAVHGNTASMANRSGANRFATKSYAPVTEQQLANVSDKHICATAIERQSPVWSSATQWVRAAQRRSLTQRRCAGIIGRFTEQQIAAVHSPPTQARANTVRPPSPSVSSPKIETATKDSDERLCQKAIQHNSPKWDTAFHFRGDVKEAKRRGHTEQQCALFSGWFTGWFTEQQIAAVHNPKPPAVIPSRKPKVVAKARPEKPKSPHRKRFSSGSGFFVSKSGHVVTNAHVVNGCSRISVGDNANAQTRATLVSKDRQNDLALLKLGSLEMASDETKSLIKKLGIKVVPLVAHGLLRSKDVELGESVLVAGFPYGELYSNTINVTVGIVSAVRGIGDDSAQFQMDAAAQSGNSGGPIYDDNGNIVGVVVAQLNKFNVAKATGSLPENVNFGIKASTVRQFLTTSGLPSKWSARSKKMSRTALAKVAQKQTLMVVCHR